MAELMHTTPNPSTLELLAAWMGRQRWFAAKGRTPMLRRLGGYRLDDPEGGVGIETLIVVDESGPAPVVYQVPLTYRSAPLTAAHDALVGTTEQAELGTRYVYDAAHDPAYTRRLLELLRGRAQAQHASVSNAVEPGVSGHPHPAFGDVEFVSSRVLSGEQSNTSIVYETTDASGAMVTVVVKIFRMLQAGENPDVVLQSALAADGSDLVPRPLGHIAGQWADPEHAGDPVEGGEESARMSGHLAFGQEFLPGTQDAWRVALDAARTGKDFTGPAFDLGVATAAVHATLARVLPTQVAVDAQREGLVRSWRSRLIGALGEAPALEAHRERIERIFERAGAASWPALQRVHGDYHLGQVLHVPGRGDTGWVLLDFEGEPLRPLSERTAPDLALRDVAGMLRSFDYVAGSLEREDGFHDAPAVGYGAPTSGSGQALQESPARQWARAAAAAFLDGYASVPDGPQGGGADPDTATLLNALVLDKALYEVVYEARNRPAWLGIPIAAVERLCERPVAIPVVAARPAAAHEPSQNLAGSPDDARDQQFPTAPPPVHPDERNSSLMATSKNEPSRPVEPAPAEAAEFVQSPKPEPVVAASPVGDAEPTVRDTPQGLEATGASATASAAPVPQEEAGPTEPPEYHSTPLAVDPHELDLLVRGGHGDPHSVLGAHPFEGGVTIRAFRPMARALRIELPDGSLHTMDHDYEGVWVRQLDGIQVSDYRLRVSYGDGYEHVQDDPYRYLPTLGEMDLYLIGEGRHEELWKVLGSHVRNYGGQMGPVSGTSFAVWAPNARAIRLVGDFNRWDGQAHPMRALGSSGVWELFVPGVGAHSPYKYEILGADGYWRGKADPLARHTECPPATASVVDESHYTWGDQEWMGERVRHTEPHNRPMSAYECHLGSWRQGSSYVDLAEHLVNYVKDLGFTHVEFLPVAEHPYGPSWGYQVTGYYAPTSRFGSPDEFRYLVDRLHQAGIGVILDWVPAHFPKDAFALARFDGQPLYEHPDPRRGDQPDWGTHIFDFGRPQVRNFLIANASYWIEEFHIDGLRVDAVASMLYLDYSREDGEWLPNQYGGRENLEAVQLLQEMNATVYRRYPGAVTIAEESTSWPGITKPTYMGGLGFGLKWNMGWMHDTLDYASQPPIYRQYHHHEMTFAMVYAYSENFVLPVSHDEVVYGKGSMLRKMPGDRWEQLAGMRLYYAFMWSHPGKQLIFMGQEFAQEAEWADARSLDWWLLDHEPHWRMHKLVKDLNHLYLTRPALWELDNDWKGFTWIDANDASGNTYSYLRFAAAEKNGERPAVASVLNFSGAEHHHYRVGLPTPGPWNEILNTDSADYGGSGVGNLGQVVAEEIPWHGQPYSALVTLPKLGGVWFEPAADETVSAHDFEIAAKDAPKPSPEEPMRAEPLRAQTPGQQRPELAHAPVHEDEARPSGIDPDDLSEPRVGRSGGHDKPAEGGGTA